MMHFSLDSLIALVAGEHHEYEDYFITVVQGRLTKSFIAEYERYGRMHDWYLDDLVVANSGKAIQCYSKNRKNTMRLGFFSGAYEYVQMTYKNVSAIEITYEETTDVSPTTRNGFGRCISNRFDVAGDKELWQGYLFEGGSMELRFEKVSLRNIRR